MANSKITIEFLDIPGHNYTINFGESGVLSSSFVERFRPNRVSSNQVTIPSDLSYDLGDGPITVYNSYCGMNFKNAFNLDYNSSNLFTVTAIADTVDPLNGKGKVVIEANYPNAVFTYTDDGLGVVDVTIENISAIDIIQITEKTFSEATNPCTHVRLNVTTSVLAVNVLSNFGNISANTNNPFYIDVLRASTVNLSVEDENGNIVLDTIRTPRNLSASNFVTTVSNSPNGATLSIQDNTPTFSDVTPLEIEYSLDNDEWQSSNVFPGLEVGDYTLYVRDQFGCSFSVDFTVNETNIYAPHFYISPSNSIRFAQRITFGDAANYKNDENTLSCEVDVNIPYKEVQLFQTADIITTQFESNYAVKDVKVVKSNGDEVNVPVIQKTNNIGIKDKRDAVKYNLGNGKTGIYFTSGNVYNYDTNATSGTHALNGTLPEWAIVGNYFNISSAWYIIENVFFDEDKNADVIVFTQTYTGLDTPIVIGCIYNLFDYEIYEFTIDMVDYINESIRVRLVNQDDHFGTLTHLSELIDVKVRHEFTLCHDYWNDDNTDIFYATGIRHRLRIPYTKVEGYLDEESSTHKTDTNTILLSGMLYKGKKFIYEPMTEGLWEKLCRALTHKNIFIDDVKFVKSGEYETDGPLEDSNLYVLSAKMLKATSVYSTDGKSILNGSSNEIEIPGIIEGDAGFIKY
jgi:hypothetical protein